MRKEQIMQDRFKFRAVLKTDKFTILVETFYILNSCYFIDINKAEVEFKCKYPDECFWDFIEEIEKQDYIQEISIDGDLIITKDFTNLVQCTGLKDKNGKLIFEGDIIVIPNQYPFYDYKNKEDMKQDLNSTKGEIKGESILNYVGVVEWIYSQWQYVYHCVNPSKQGISEGINRGLNDFGFDETKNTCYEVIGNIYENPELLSEVE
nr:MAG TPA: YopX protein [Caudoviricetes sp.]